MAKETKLKVYSNSQPDNYYILSTFPNSGSLDSDGNMPWLTSLVLTSPFSSISVGVITLIKINLKCSI